jgi:DNA-binding CsgD family transcriptional regulator
VEAEESRTLHGAQRPRHDLDLVLLRPRERQVLAELAEGRSNRAIATRLGISENTVKFHVSRICRELGVTSRPELVALVRDRAPHLADPVG